MRLTRKQRDCQELQDYRHLVANDSGFIEHREAWGFFLWYLGKFCLVREMGGDC